MRDKIAQYLRRRFSVPASAKVTVGPLTPSIYPGFDRTTVTLTEGNRTGTQSYYVSKGGQYLIQGVLYPLNVDPRKEVEEIIQTKDQPSAGSADAPVTIVEYADLECPMCAQMQQVLENQLLPKYDGKVRVIFKEFPLFSIHPWAVMGALASECAYQINPSDFSAYRTLIFKNQATIQAKTARDQLLALGAQAGLDRTKLASCIDAKSALPRVRQDFLEGEKLGVSSTPTFFINGKMYAGALTPAELFKAVDEALAQATSK